MSDIIADAVAIMLSGSGTSELNGLSRSVTETGTYYAYKEDEGQYNAYLSFTAEISDCYDEGYQAGYDDGYAKGYDDGYWTGYNNGVEAADCDGAYLSGYAAGLVGA